MVSLCEHYLSHQSGDESVFRNLSGCGIPAVLRVGNVDTADWYQLDSNAACSSGVYVVLEKLAKSTSKAAG